MAASITAISTNSGGIEPSAYLHKQLDVTKLWGYVARREVKMDIRANRRRQLLSRIDRRMMLQAMAGATALGAGVQLAGGGRDRAAGSSPERARGELSEPTYFSGLTLLSPPWVRGAGGEGGSDKIGLSTSKRDRTLGSAPATCARLICDTSPGGAAARPAPVQGRPNGDEKVDR